jgi:ATP-binding cassette, subfamily F, member 3
MIVISLSNVSLTLGAHPIFKNLFWEIQHDQKIGLIGPNGAGKSSLFKLITGEYTPEPGGAVVKARGISLGYLPQQPGLDSEQSVLDSALEGNPRVGQVEAELTHLEASLGDPKIYNDPKKLTRALEQHQALLDEFTALDGEHYLERVQGTLLGLGLSEADFDKPVGLLSGGQKKLVGLARLLLAKPSVLLLDEPDNHLDLAGKGFLERLIQNYPGAVVIVSHDRYLLDAVVTDITELEDGVLTNFKGDYSSYALDKQMRLRRQDELYHVQQREISRIEAAIKRYSIWAKVYDSEKFAKRAKSIQKRLDKVDRIDRPVLERRRMNLALTGWRGSSKVLELSQVGKSFDELTILNGLDLTLWHGERVGLIGPNGAGKSVLFRLILGSEQPDSGEIYWGPSVKTGYYAQEHETLDPEQTLIDSVRYAGEMSLERAAAFLNHYLFTYRQASQKVQELSGGERSRLQLALLVLSGANCLLLDEPTNNLDIASAETLEDALADFEGTVFVISHDRYFLDRIVDRMLVLEDGCLLEFAGGYSDYLIKTGRT